MIRPVKAYEIPFDLLKQKTCWDLTEFFRYAILAKTWYAYVWGDPGEEWAAAILIDDPIYRSIVVETIIVDEECQALVPQVLRDTWELSEVLARHLGRKKISAFSFSPKRHLEMLGNPPGVRRLETRLQKEVRQWD